MLVTRGNVVLPSIADGGAKSRLETLDNVMKTAVGVSTETVPFPAKPVKRQIVWSMVFILACSHLLALWALYPLFFSIRWLHLTYAIIMVIATTLGGTMGAHRYYTHHSFEASVPLQVVLMLLQTMSGQDSIYRWAREHRLHHKYTDTDADPQNASNGFFFSHVGWLMVKKHPLVKQKGKGVDMSDLESDPIVMFQKKYYFSLTIVFTLIVPTLLPVYVLNEPWLDAFLVSSWLRVVIVLHFLFLINSWAHRFGTKPYDKRIRAVDSALMSFFIGGEGWHNYHHTFPWDYRASEFGSPYNLTTTVIDICAYFGWAKNLKTTSTEMVVSRALRTGDGTPLRNKRIPSRNLKDGVQHSC